MKYAYDKTQAAFASEKHSKLLNTRERGWVKRKLKSVSAKQAVKDDDIVISGYFNFFDTDNVMEKLDPQSVKLDRFVKNPVVLFNHNIDWPLGEVLVETIEQRNDGLYGSVRIPANQQLDICKHARAMAEDGTLRTFSVRFGHEDWEQDDDEPTVRVAKNWELQEVSLVTIPAQPDSTFELAEASKTLTSVKGGFMAVKKQALKLKGAAVAALVNDRLSAVSEQREETLDSLIQQIAAEASLEVAEVQDLLAGDLTPVPDAALEVIAKKLEISVQELKDANASDVENAPAPTEEPVKAALPPDVSACVSEKIPVLIAEGMEQEQAVAVAISMCSEKGGCPITSVANIKQAELATYLALADECKAKMETVPLADKPVEDTPDQALLKTLCSMMGAAVEEMKSMGAEMKQQGEYMKRMCDQMEKGYMQPKMDTEPPPAEPNPVEVEKRAKSIEAHLSRLEQSLDRLRAVAL